MQVKMLRFKSSVFILFLAIVLIFSCMGCKPPEKADDSQDTSAGITMESKKTLNEILADPNFTYPVKYPEGTENITLTFFWRDAPSGKPTLNETKWWEAVYEKTGINIKFIHPPKGQEKERANILISSGELPDIMWNVWLDYPGGINAAVEQKIIINLTDLVPKYAPTFYNKVIVGGDEIDRKYFKNDDGDILHIAYIRDSKIRGTWRGPVVRKDWLDKLGLDLPVTIDDWEEMLTLFRDKMGATAPFTARTWSGTTYPADGFLTGAFDFTLWYYRDYDGIVQYGYAHKNFFDFLVLYKRWYDSGLIDRDIANMDRSLARSKMIKGEAGATFEQGSGVTAIRKGAIENGDTELKLQGVLNPVLKEGDPVRWGHAEWGYGDSIAITTSCKYPELALRFIDFGFTDEGILLYNFGEEGTTYYRDSSGKIKSMLTDSLYYIAGERNKFYTDEQLKEIGQLGYTCNKLPTVNSAFPDSLNDPTDPALTWYKATPEALKRLLPPITYTQQESEEIARMEAEISTYAEEMFLKFLFGDVPMDEANKEAYYNQLEKLGLSRVLEIKRTAVERFFNR